MKEISVDASDLGSILPTDIAVVLSIQNDTLLCNGAEIIASYLEEVEGGAEGANRLAKALHWWVKDCSRNSYEVILLKDGEFYNTTLDLF